MTMAKVAGEKRREFMRKSERSGKRNGGKGYWKRECRIRKKDKRTKDFLTKDRQDLR